MSKDQQKTKKDQSYTTGKNERTGSNFPKSPIEKNDLKKTTGGTRPATPSEQKRTNPSQDRTTRRDNF